MTILQKVGIGLAAIGGAILIGIGINLGTDIYKLILQPKVKKFFKIHKMIKRYWKL